MRYITIAIMVLMLGFGLFACSEVEDIGEGIVSTKKHADVTKDQANLTTLQQSINNFRAMNGRNPESLEELKTSAGLDIDLSKYEYDPQSGKVIYHQWPDK